MCLFSATSSALATPEENRPCVTDTLSFLDKVGIERMSHSLLLASFDGCDGCNGWVSAAEGETIALSDLIP
jgi:hypothetical protein